MNSPFPSSREILQEFLDDRVSGQYPIRNTEIEYPRGKGEG